MTQHRKHAAETRIAARSGEAELPFASSTIPATIQTSSDPNALLTAGSGGTTVQASRWCGEKDARLLLDRLVNEPEQHEEFMSQIVATLGSIGSEIAAAVRARGRQEYDRMKAEHRHHL